MDRGNSSETPWYVRSFGKLYPLVYKHRDRAAAGREIEILFELLDLSGNESVLDLCCGAGRHTAAIRDLGYDVIGVDLSPELLRKARQRPGLEDRVMRGDMRRIPFPDAAFDVVVNLFTSFGYFEEEGQNEAAFGEMARVLRPGGRLVIDHINRGLLERTLVPESSEERDGLLIEHKRRIEGARAVKEITVKEPGGRVSRFIESVRLYGPGDFEDLCARWGLVSPKIVGSFNGQEFGPGSERMILLASKPGENAS